MYVCLAKREGERMNEDVIRVANLTKFYKQKKVLDNVDRKSVV